MTKDEARLLCKTDAIFLGRALGYDFQEDVHRELFDLFPRWEPGKQLFELSSGKNQLILWPRGHYKTSAIAVRIVQQILRYPDIRVLIMQGNLKLTRGWLAEIKSHFIIGRNPKSHLAELFPDFCTDKLGTADKFTVPARVRMHLKEATVTVASPKAVQTGQHYDDFYPDDLVHTGNFRNVELLDKLYSEFMHFVPLIDPGGYTTVTGTRYSFADIYGRIIKQNKGDWSISVKAAYDEKGKFLFPARLIADGRTIGFTPELLAQIQRDDPEMFSAQYMNRCVSVKQQIFNRDLILGSVRSTKHEEYPAGAPCIFAVDLAEAQKADSDNSVITVGRQDGLGRIWVVECVGSTWSPAALATVILQQVWKHKPVCVYLEKSPGSKFFKEYLETVARDKGMYVAVDFLEASRTKDAKYLRIGAIESLFRSKRLFLCSGIADFEKVEEEFTQFPRGRHDDRPDCIALLAQHLAGQTLFRRPTNTWAQILAPRQKWDEDEKKESPLMGDGWVC